MRTSLVTREEMIEAIEQHTACIRGNRRIRKKSYAKLTVFS